MKHANVYSDTYYPADGAHLRTLLGQAYSFAPEGTCICSIVPVCDGAIRCSEGCVEFLRTCRGNGLCSHTSIIFDGSYGTTQPLDHQQIAAAAKAMDLDVTESHKAFEMTMAHGTDPSQGKIAGRRHDETGFEIMNALTSRYDLLLLLHSHEYTRFVHGMVCTLAQSKEVQVASIEYPSSVVDAKCLERHWAVYLYSSSELPRWEAYDHIEHFLAYGWRNFEENQKKAVEQIGSVLKPLDVTEIHDVGCGSGRILEGIIDILGGDCEFRAYDTSERQVTNTVRRVGRRVETYMADLNEVVPTRTKGAVVMFLGNTLAHIGSHRFREWLRAEGSKTPEYILIDFALQWKELLDQAEPEVVCGRTEHFAVSETGLGGSVRTHMTTAGGPGWVKRGIVLQFDDDSDQDARRVNTISRNTHRLFTKQYADAPATYFNVLRAAGYKQSDKGNYVSGWGHHDYHLFQLGPEASIEWPAIPDWTNARINCVWYEFLCRLWEELKTANCVKRDYYPFAILPFGSEVYARCIPRDSHELLQYRPLFSATMWVVDPRNKMLKHAGAAKSEDELPYAPSVYKAMLSDAPIGILEHFDQTVNEFRVDSNSRDLELWHLEREWMRQGKREGNDTYYALPVYARGVPVFLIAVARRDHLETVDVLVGTLKGEGIGIAQCLQPFLSGESLVRLVREFHEACDGDRTILLSLVDLVLGSGPDRRKWTSWLETVPGGAIHVGDRQANTEYNAFKNEYGRIAEEMCAEAGDNKDQAGMGSVRIGNVEGGVQIVSGNSQYVRNGNISNIDVKGICADIETLKKHLSQGAGSTSAENASMLRVLGEANLAAKKNNRTRLASILKKGGAELYRLSSSMGTTLLTAYMKAKCGLG